MAKVIHLYCRHCGEAMKNNPWPYCNPCNIALCYKAMPLLLGMMMTGQLFPTAAAVRSAPPAKQLPSRWVRYPHLKDIMD